MKLPIHSWFHFLRAVLPRSRRQRRANRRRPDWLHARLPRLGLASLRHCQYEALERRELLSTTTTHLTSSLTAPYLGQNITLTATVSSTGGTPSGNVQFYQSNPSDGPDFLLATQALAVGQATYTFTGNSLGYETLYAVYTGNSSFSRSVSPYIAENVTKVPTTTTLSANVATSLYGQPVTISASVSAANGTTPTGSLSLYQLNPGDGPSILLGTKTLDSHGNASCTTSTLTLGSDKVFAVYAGSSTLSSSGSANLGEAVLSVFKPAITSSNASALPGQAVQFTATSPAEAISCSIRSCFPPDRPRRRPCRFRWPAATRSTRFIRATRRTRRPPRHSSRNRRSRRPAAPG